MDTPKEIAQQYLGESAEITDHLGSGTDGTVYKITTGNAIKIIRQEQTYKNELYCYLRLREENVTTIAGHAVPRLIHFNDQLRTIEISIVTPPWIIDFGKSCLDYPRSWEVGTEESWLQQQEEAFGDNWPHAEFIFFELQKLGIYHYDLNPHNIRFA